MAASLSPSNGVAGPLEEIRGNDEWADEDDDSEEDEDEDEGDESSEETEDGDAVDIDGPAGDSNAEAAIEGDFDRLVQGIRQSGGGANAGLLTKMWDFNLEEKEAEFRDDLRDASGVGRSRKGKKGHSKRGRRAGPVLSQQVRALIGEGNQAYVDGDVQETLRIMQEVIRIEPRAAQAWSVLAQCYADMNEPQKALQLRIMAAHLMHDAEEWERLAKQSVELGYNQQALYCYGKVYSLDPSNLNALWDRATLAKEIGELKTARNTFLAILKRLPHNLTVLDELRPILIELSDFDLCANLFSDAFAHYYAMFPTGVGLDPDSEQEVPGGGFGMMHILVLADLHNSLGQYDRAIEAIRKGCRWLQSRAQQKFWDVCEDDREYYVGAEGTRGGEGELQAGNYPLDVNARHRLAVARIKMGDVEEGKKHADLILAQDVLEYAPLFTEIGDAYFEREMYPEARHIYEILGGDAGTSSFYVLLQAAACRRMVGDIREAAEVYEHVIAADPTHNEAKMKLAEIYEILNEPRKALELVFQVMDSRRRRPRQGTADGTDDANTTSLFEEKARVKGKLASAKANKLSAAQLRELEVQKEREVTQGFRRVKELWPRMLAGEEEAEREWLVEAEKLIESFRETRNLFQTSRHQGFRGMFPRSSRRQTAEASEESMASRLQLELGRDTIARKARGDGINTGGLDTFRTISFDEWLRLFLHYTFLLTRRGQYNLAQEVLRHILYSSAYQSRLAQDSIRLALMTCAIHVGQFPTAVEQSRKLINAYQFNNEPLRILVASLGSGLRATDAFLASTLSKHLLREIKLADAALRKPDAVRWNSTLRRYGLGSSKSGDGDDVDEEDDAPREGSTVSEEKASLPTKGNPVNVAVYGQICLAAKSYQSALFYLLHAYDYCPDDPLICLCLAIASFGRAMQRQADNRNHLITQGMAFLSRYRTIRGAKSEDVDEVEFNFGRAFQQLGLHSLAVRHYERVLTSAEKNFPEDGQECGLAREAAYNLSLIYVTTGATPLAEKLYRRWLSV
ncbi:TPR-like protein [Fomitopsis serialis]|uniref:TPR-like protein n=1 Tax=Fomitopsis serialis TaxID=139415 RepID=UPI002007D814|nr:TPR-like protein [Neoantrodia serialis]KAH9921621.1 TPR-like protein [Neoantrodia serialis]